MPRSPNGRLSEVFRLILYEFFIPCVIYMRCPSQLSSINRLISISDEQKL